MTNFVHKPSLSLPLSLPPPAQVAEEEEGAVVEEGALAEEEGALPEDGALPQEFDLPEPPTTAAGGVPSGVPSLGIHPSGVPQLGMSPSGVHSSAAGMHSSSGMYSSAAGMHSSAAGMHSSTTGMYSSTAGMHSSSGCIPGMLPTGIHPPGLFPTGLHPPGMLPAGMIPPPRLHAPSFTRPAELSGPRDTLALTKELFSQVAVPPDDEYYRGGLRNAFETLSEYSRSFGVTGPDFLRHMFAEMILGREKTIQLKQISFRDHRRPGHQSAKRRRPTIPPDNDMPSTVVPLPATVPTTVITWPGTADLSDITSDEDL